MTDKIDTSPEAIAKMVEEARGNWAWSVNMRAHLNEVGLHDIDELNVRELIGMIQAAATGMAFALKALAAERDRLREALMDATDQLVRAADAYEKYSGNSERRCVRDPFFKARLREFEKALTRARAVLGSVSGSKPPKSLDMPLEEAIARLLQTDPEEIADIHERVRKGQREVNRNVEERRKSIRRGVRPEGKKFRI